MKNKIAVIGAGSMGGAIARGAVSAGFCSAEEIVCTARGATTLEKLAAAVPGIGVSADNRAAAESAEIVVLAVKPWIADAVLEEIRGAFAAGTRTLVSVVAGLPLARLRAAAGTPETPVFVAIPNTAAAVAQSMTFIASDGAPEAAARRVEALFSALGKAVFVPEAQLAAGTALASCGIAFAMRYVRASMQGGVELGLSAALAREAALQTLKGAAELLAATGEHPESAVDKVTTPGGLTIRGLNAMEESGFSAAVVRGLRACCSR